MSGFRSTTDPRDRAPYECASGYRSSHLYCEFGQPHVLAPRPEMGPPINPILSAVREDVTEREGPWNAARLFGSWLTWVSNGPTLSDVETKFGPDEVEHARKVLTRLRNLAAQADEPRGNDERP